MRLYRNLTLLPKYLGAPVSSSLHSTARQLIRIEPFRSCGFSTPSTTTPMTKVQAFEVVLKLTLAEREALREALNQYESDNVKRNLEGEVAANRWASRVGELRSGQTSTAETKVVARAIGNNPEDSSAVKLDKTVLKPSRDDIMKLMLVNAVPFLGFGFLDNFFMIIAGDYIEHTLGIYMCISTMAAAGLGNTISDVLGLGLAHHVETFCVRLGLHPPILSKEQLSGPSCRRASSYGRALGITIGCILGMCPLLFMNKKSKEKETNETPVVDVAL